MIRGFRTLILCGANTGLGRWAFSGRGGDLGERLALYDFTVPMAFRPAVAMAPAAAPCAAVGVRVR
ncbi:MAG: hypothetical protein ACM3IH_21335, partial [Sphingobacteriales bacterium]